MIFPSAPKDSPFPSLTQNPPSNPQGSVPSFSSLDLAAVGTLPGRDFSLYLLPASHPNHLSPRLLPPMTVQGLSHPLSATHSVCCYLWENNPLAVLAKSEIQQGRELTIPALLRGCFSRARLPPVTSISAGSRRECLPRVPQHSSLNHPAH